ncbi:hypothetical protein [Arthrobacter sp. FW306-06-A]|uniref:hypothetical protein n=1 Tax=Arthrobacter sp. FW306-06-A TaxID=2879621 RepID=UPI001F38F5B5|nr:hypothetical protein [Arthrobacter sp. FW306-06-A]UKA72241.1 hypothetical protein LFT49_05785 [Arthrobacter sp. FW306-06-A]
MPQDDHDLVPGTHSVPAGDQKWQLQFINGPHPEGGLELFLVRYVVGVSDECQYRTDGEWLNAFQCKDEHAWFFLAPPDEEYSLFDYSQMDERSIGVEVGYLVDQAVEWYDHPGKRSDVAYEVFGIEEQQLFVHRPPGQADLEMELATKGLLWSRSSDHQWKLLSNLTLRERVQRAVLIDHAEKLIRESNTVRFSRSAQDDCCDLQITAAIALGSPFRVIPTFDSMLFELIDKNTLRWESVRPLLACSAEAALLSSGDSDEIAGISVRSGPHTWLRYKESWLPVNRTPDHEQILLPLAMDDLREAVLVWDVAEKAKSPRPKRREYPSKSIHFVTRDDPGDIADFAIQGLVRGSVDTGYGESRRAGAWERGYWPVLNFENHMPTDEGDLRPWGGRYLCQVDTDLEPFAIEFWDSNSESELEAGEWVSLSDFTTWIATET